MASIALNFIAPILLLAAGVTAQRPENVSICDYYTEQKYGEPSQIHQFHMIQGIVSLAFAGSSSLPAENVSEKITGILNPGEEDGTPVNLLPWFNGSKASSNMNNQAVGINWLDDGGVQPLLDYLSKKTDNVTLKPESNEFRLFGHFFYAFSRVFGCSKPPAPLPSTNGPVSLAYAHKFMNLNHTQLSYFIDQLTMSAEHFGFSEGDATTINESINARYNVRCAPAVSFNPQSKPQLLSLCQHPTCPLAVPNADCKAYVNLTAEGTSGDSNTVAPSSLVPTTITTGLPADQVPTETPTRSSTPSATPEPTDDKALSSGGIAGVAVGGAAILVALLALLLWWKKRNNKKGVPASVGPSTTTAVSEWASKNPASPYPTSEAGGGGGYFNNPSQGYSTPPPGSPGWGPGGIGASGIGAGGYGSMNQQGMNQQGINQQGYAGQASDHHGSWQWTPAPVRQSPRVEMEGSEGPAVSPQEMAGDGFEGQGTSSARERRMSPLSR